MLHAGFFFFFFFQTSNINAAFWPSKPIFKQHSYMPSSTNLMSRFKLHFALNPCYEEENDALTPQSGSGAEIISVMWFDSLSVCVCAFASSPQYSVGDNYFWKAKIGYAWPLKTLTSTNAMYAQRKPFQINVVLITAFPICSNMGHVM